MMIIKSNKGGVFAYLFWIFVGMGIGIFISFQFLFGLIYG